MGNLRVEWQWEVVAHKINGWIVDVDPPATIRHPPSTSLQRIRVGEVVAPRAVRLAQWITPLINSPLLPGPGH